MAEQPVVSTCNWCHGSPPIYSDHGRSPGERFRRKNHRIMCHLLRPSFNLIKT
ncbi:Protein of unknown function [Pyronema omphalodes CBS 100304]|uniref:Uncharacterized protein n=1 Tax=Pyronema omphalodes (strain CBS 100304) TaxID=1076935 RepID=U4KVM8_PYROM|nr:Protein of unknown function [Pyronema omphalodes CBS 100304]